MADIGNSSAFLVTGESAEDLTKNINEYFDRIFLQSGTTNTVVSGPHVWAADGRSNALFFIKSEPEQITSEPERAPVRVSRRG